MDISRLNKRTEAIQLLTMPIVTSQTVLKNLLNNLEKQKTVRFKGISINTLISTVHSVTTSPEVQYITGFYEGL